jgi:hypothetical protein
MPPSGVGVNLRVVVRVKPLLATADAQSKKPPPHHRRSAAASLVASRGGTKSLEFDAVLDDAGCCGGGESRWRR